MLKLGQIKELKFVEEKHKNLFFRGLGAEKAKKNPKYTKTRALPTFRAKSLKITPLPPLKTDIEGWGGEGVQEPPHI